MLVVTVGYLLITLAVARGSLYDQSLVLTAACFAILAISLDMVAGMTGLYSLGHAGLFAVGAYATTLLNLHQGMGVFTALPIVVIGAGVVGLIIGSLSLRVSGLYFAITTFIFTLVVGVLAINACWRSWTWPMTDQRKDPGSQAASGGQAASEPRCPLEPPAASAPPWRRAPPSVSPSSRSAWTWWRA